MRRPLAPLVVMLATATSPRAAHADLPVLVLPDDGDTHARAAAKIARLSLWSTRLDDRDGEADLTMIWMQVGVGPVRNRLPFRGASLGPLDRWSARLRLGLFVPDDHQDLLVGPLTVAVQRFAPLAIADNLPILHAQIGVEVAVASPWLDHDAYEPGTAVRIPYGPDAELAERGWSVRPASVHLRADLMACRSWFTELGAGPELFRSTADRARPLALGARWHAALGVALGCIHQRRRWINDLAIVGEVRGRYVALRGDEDPTYDGTFGLALQYNPGAYSIALLGSALATAPMVGVRLQYRWKESRP